MRKVIAVVLLLFWPTGIIAQQKCACVPINGGLNADFFGLTYLSQSNVPTVPFGIVRLWNTTGAGWFGSSNNCGTPDFTTINTWIAQAHTNGQEVMWTAGRTPGCAIGGCPASCSGTFAPNGYAQPPSDIDTGDTQWKNFVTALVNNSLAQATHIKFYECVNEFDLLGEWTGTAQQLVKLCGDMKNIVHALDPSAQVWGPAAGSGNSFGVHGYTSLHGGQGYIAAGGDATYDVMNLHAYQFGCSSVDCGTPEQIGGIGGGIRAYLAAAQALTSKPIGFSEGSWGCGTQNTISDALKVNYLTREYLIMWAAGITHYVFYEWDNNGQPLGGTGTCGTIAFNDTPGTISAAYQNIQPWIVGSQLLTGVNPCTTVGTTTTCTYTLSGAPAEILWDTTNTPTVTVPSNFTTQHKVDGTSSAIVSHQVTLGATPIQIL